MRIHMIAKLLIAAFAASLWAAPSSAQAKDFWVYNKAEEKLKVCAYRGKLSYVPLSCTTVAKGRSKLLTLKRNDIRSPIELRVFRPGIIDRELCGKEEINITQTVVGFNIYAKKPCVELGHQKEKDDRVEARTWEKGDKILVKIGRVGHWYPGTIERVNSNSNYHVRHTQGRYNVDASIISGDHIRAGTRISGNWLGKGVWYPGVIASRDGDSVKINYDDGDKETTTLSKIRVAFADLPEAPKQYMMRACNNIDEPLFFAISFAAPSRDFRTEGWWQVRANSCILVDMTKRWKLAGIAEGERAQTYIYGETKGMFGGAIKKTWEGDDPLIAFCVNSSKLPYFKNHLFRPNTRDRAPCKGAGKELVQMSEVDFPTSGTTMRFNFDGN